MKIYLDNFTDFVPGPSARDLWDEIDRTGKMDSFEALLDECYPDGLSDSHLDDLLRFEEDWVRDMLDMKDPDEDEEENKYLDQNGCCEDCNDCEFTCKAHGDGEEEEDDLLTDLHAEQNEQQ